MSSVSDVSLEALIATTRVKISKQFANSVPDRNPLLNEIKKAGNLLEMVDGGRSFYETAIGDDSQAVGTYKGYDTLNVNEQEGIKTFKYEPAFAYATVVIDNPTLAMNAGESATLSILEGRLEQAKSSLDNLMDQIACGAYGAGVNGEWLGLQDIISDDNTATIQGTGIDRSLAANAKLRNQVDTTSIASATAFNTSQAGRKVMTDLYYASSFGVETPGLLLMTREVFSAYNLSLQENERFIGRSDTQGGGFPGLVFMNNVKVHYGDNVPSGHFYFINPKHLKMKVLSKKNFDMSEFIPAYNQDAKAAKITVGGQLCTGAPKFHGVATGMGF